MIATLLTALISVLYILGVILVLFVELGFVIVLLLWPVLLPVAIGWKFLISLIWVIILALLSSN